MHGGARRLGFMLLAVVCNLQCMVDLGGSAEKSEVETKAEGAAKPKTDEQVEVEVERSVCDDIDFEIERIVLSPADPPFHDRPFERVSLRVTNRGTTAVELEGGGDAVFLDEGRAVIEADVHHTGWFMPRVLPAKSNVMVEILVAEHAGKALRSIEVQAEPEDRSSAECKIVDGLLRTKPAEPAAEAI